MTQPDFDFTAPTEKRPHKRVRQTSKEAYAIGRATFTGRRGDTLRWLSAFWNLHNYSPTSAELAVWAHRDFLTKSWEWILLYVRRGLSDLHTVGVVEHVPLGVRLCNIANVRCETWRIREIGSEESR